MLDEDWERFKLEVMFVEILAFTELSEPSTLEDEFERLKLEVWFAMMLELSTSRTASTLAEEIAYIDDEL
jgi:hypothetical protein